MNRARRSWVFTPSQAFYLQLGIGGLSLLAVLVTGINSFKFIAQKIILSCQSLWTNNQISPNNFLFVSLSLFCLYIVATGIIFGLKSYFLIHEFTRRINSKKIPVSKDIQKIATRFQIAKRITIIADDQPLALCFGLKAPKICLSTGMVNILTRDQLEAVIAHETYHLNHMDPLKIFISQVFSSIFFFLPVIKDLGNYYALSKEIAADKLATKKTSLVSLCDALVKVLGESNMRFNGIAFFFTINSFEQRVNALTDHKSQLFLQITKRNIFVTVIAYISLLFIINLPVHASELVHGQCTRQPAESDWQSSHIRNATPATYSTQR